MRGRREHRASDGGAALFLLRLRAVALAAEDIDSPMAMVAHELRRLCVSFVFSQCRFCCSVQRLCQSFAGRFTRLDRTLLALVAHPPRAL